MKNIRIIFIGTSPIGTPLLKALSEDERFDIPLVITQPDRPAGRKMESLPSPIKKTAEALGLPVFQPENINSSDSRETIHKTKPDLIVLYAYGQILSAELLKIPKYGCINIHASLLPKYRGASPIQQALLERDKVTGISLMQMVEKMDAGPVYKQINLPIAPDDDAITLTEKLANLSAYETPNLLVHIVNGDLTPESQDENQATCCQKIQKSDGEINWKEDAKIIAAKIRAFAGWPGTFTFWNKRRLKIIRGSSDEYAGESGPACRQAGLVFQKDHLILIGAGKGSIVPEKLQLEGKAEQLIDEFVRGYPDFIGSTLD